MRIAAIVVAMAFITPPIPRLQPAPVLTVHVKPGGPRYEYVPFDVAAGTEALTISYTYSGDPGSSAIDLGLFEPGPLTFGTTSFRGYSGGAQRTITVGRNHASPGYKTGPLPAGQWHVMLGIYRVAPAGVDVEISIAELRDEPDVQGHAIGSGMQVADAGRVGSDPPRPRWYSGALHLHTNHSDGAIDPAALSDAARSAGFDFMVITDHNNTTHAREPLPASPLTIIGEEVTTPAGHASVWGLRPGAWFDFRVGPPDETRGKPGGAGAGDTLEQMIAEAHGTGALFAIDHPVDNCAGCSWDQPVPDGIDAVEIWQNEKAPRDAEVAFWDRLLRAGRHVTAVGVSDWHRPPARIDMAAVRVLADSLTEQAVLDGLRRGRVIVMRDSETAPPSVTASCGSHSGGIGDTLVCSVGDVLKMTTEADAFRKGRVDFIWNAARMTSRNVGHGATFSMPAGNGYLRAQLYDAADRPVAITNPVYVEIR